MKIVKMVFMFMALMFLFAPDFATARVREAIGDGDDVNNGGGSAEKTLLYVYSKLENYIHLCLLSPSCKLEPLQRQWLTKIYEGMPKEKQNLSPLVFLSEKAHPGFFIIDQAVKVAKTGSTIGSPIYVNLDLVYSKNAAGYYESISIPESVTLLIHELGHHYGVVAHEWLDVLGLKVAMLIQQNIYLTPLLPWNKEISVTVINSLINRGFPEVLITAYGEMVNISSLVKDEIKCPVLKIPVIFLPIPDITLSTKKPLGILLHNIRWGDILHETAREKYTIEGNLALFCNAGNDVLTANNYKINISFNIGTSEASAQNHKLDTGDIEIEQIYQPWYKIIKLPFFF